MQPVKAKPSGSNPREFGFKDKAKEATVERATNERVIKET